MRLLSSIIGLALLTGITLHAANKAEGNRGQLSEQDYKFICAAASGGMAEVKAGEIARSKAADSAVKQFGERMVMDHSKAGSELKALAAKKGATLPTRISDEHQQMVSRIQGAAGKDFDKIYISEMVEDHKKDLQAFQEAAAKSDDPDLKEFAAKTATMVAQHLSHAERLATTQK